MRPDRRELALVQTIVETCRDITFMTAGLSYETFASVRPIQMGVERGIEIIGEAVNHLSDGFKDAHPEIPWHEIVGQAMMTIPQLPFGRTGHLSSRVIFGGASLGRVTQDVADRALDVLLEHGINHIDVAASYGDAELRIAPWLKRYPDQFFIATKTGERRAAAAREELERSLDRLGGTTSICGNFIICRIPFSGTTRSAPGA